MSTGLLVTVSPEGTLVDAKRIRRADRAAEAVAARKAELAALLSRLTPERVPIRALRHIDPTYQRGAKSRVIEGIVRDFNWAALVPPLVSRRQDGTYWVIDGQNRVAAVRELVGGEHELLCTIVPDLTITEEARVFALINGSRSRSNTSPIEQWKAQLAAEDPETLAINAILAEFGLTIGQRTTSSRVMQSVGAVQLTYRLGGAGTLRAVLSLLLAAWGDDAAQTRDALRALFINGMYAFLARYGKHPRFDRAHLITRLRLTTPPRLMAQGRDLRSDALHMNARTAVARMMLEHYNARLSSNRLPSWYAKASRDEARREGAAA